MKESIKILLNEAIIKAKETGQWSDFDMVEILVDYPKSEQFGDYTSNIAMVLAKKLGKSPMEIAGQIVTLLHCYIVSDAGCHPELVSGSSFVDDDKKIFEKIEIAQPGYINFFLSKKCLQDVALKINTEKENFGNSQMGNGFTINNEFISANPTGPLHLGNGRGGFYGDSLTRILRKAGFGVTNEFYVNDAGGQVLKLGHSVLKDEESVYAGEYIDELNKKYGELTDIREIGEKAASDILENIIKKTVSEKMHITYDVWSSEKQIKKDGYIDRAINTLREKGLTYELDGATWIKTTEYGDDKDRVLTKSDGTNAYIAGDCGYVLHKIERGYDRLIMSLGADHHGYVARLKAVAKALGFSGDYRITLSQLVRLVKDGKEARMSKRAGNVVYIDDLVAEIGHDVTRFFFLMYSPDTHMNFDLGLAKEQSQKNPVFYVQYAHARICSILAKYESQTSNVKSPNVANLSLLVHEKELNLIKELNRFPELVEEIANSYEVHKLPHYAMRLADKFHSFYDACRVIDENDIDSTKARLFLVNAARIVLSETLRLIGVDAPEKM